MVVEDEVELAKREKKNQNLGYKECMFRSGMEEKNKKTHKAKKEEMWIEFYRRLYKTLLKTKMSRN